MDNNLISEIKDLLIKQHESISGVNSTMWKQMIDTQKGMETKIDALIVQTTKTNGSVVTLKAEMFPFSTFKATGTPELFPAMAQIFSRLL